MNTLEAQIKIVSDKLQQLLKKNASLQKENEMLAREIGDLKEKDKEHKASIFSLNQKVNILQATSGNMSDEDRREFEKRIDLYIKEIDKCIGILSE